VSWHRAGVRAGGGARGMAGGDEARDASLPDAGAAAGLVGEMGGAFGGACRIRRHAVATFGRRQDRRRRESAVIVRIARRRGPRPIARFSRRRGEEANAVRHVGPSSETLQSRFYTISLGGRFSGARSVIGRTFFLSSINLATSSAILSGFNSSFLSFRSGR
jgi:hypothetical protein